MNMSPDKVVSVYQRYRELRRAYPISNPLAHAGTGGSDGQSTGGLKAVLLFMCEVGAALAALTDDERDLVRQYFKTWMEHRACEKEATEAGASAMPGAPRHKTEKTRRRDLNRMRRRADYRAALDKLGDELGRRLGRTSHVLLASTPETQDNVMVGRPR